MSRDAEQIEKTQGTPDEQESRKQDSGPVQGKVSRRSFLSGLGAASLAATATPILASVPLEQASAERMEQAPVASGDTIPVTLHVNGKDYNLQLEPRVALLDCLREYIDLPGTKKGCDHGQCGACTVHVNGKRVLSCMSFAWMHANDQITTIEGLGTPENLHPMQAAFVENDAYQCGYCTSGQIMSATALLKEPVGPTDQDVKGAMYGNICRCGAYPNIVAAVQQVRRLNGGSNGTTNSAQGGL